MAAQSHDADAQITIFNGPAYILYTGTKEQLISHRLALAHHFPVLPKRSKYECFDSPYGNHLISVSRKKGGLFEVYQTRGFLLYRVDRSFRGFLSNLMADNRLSLVKGESA